MPGLTKNVKNGITASPDELIALRNQVFNNRSYLLRTSTQAGTLCSTLRGRGMEFAEVRNYQAGDEIRHMEWRVTARTGRPHIKLFHAERERPVFFVLDFNHSMFFGTQHAFKSVIAARLCALLAWQAFRQKDKVGGLCFNSEKHAEFAPCARDAYFLRFLGQIAAWTSLPTKQFKNSRPISDALLKIRRITKPGSLIILISDFYAFDAACDAHLAQLRRHHDILAFHICDPLEINSPIAGVYPFTNGKEHMLLDTTDDEISHIYQQLWAQKQANILHRCQKAGIIYNQVESQNSLLPFLKRITIRGNYGK